MQSPQVIGTLDCKQSPTKMYNSDLIDLDIERTIDYLVVRYFGLFYKSIA